MSRKRQTLSESAVGVRPLGHYMQQPTGKFFTVRFGELTTLRCLKHSNFKIIEPTFRRFRKFNKDKILLCLKSFDGEGGETSEH
jgi:hypothetical protein